MYIQKMHLDLVQNVYLNEDFYTENDFWNISIINKAVFKNFKYDQLLRHLYKVALDLKFIY